MTRVRWLTCYAYDSAQGTSFGMVLLLAIAISSLFMTANIEPANLSVGNVNVQVSYNAWSVAI